MSLSLIKPELTETMCRGSTGYAGEGSEHLSSRGFEFIETISIAQMAPLDKKWLKIHLLLKKTESALATQIWTAWLMKLGMLSHFLLLYSFFINSSSFFSCFKGLIVLTYGLASPTMCSWVSWYMVFTPI